MDINFLKNPNFSNFSSPIYDGENGFVPAKKVDFIAPPEDTQNNIDANIIRLFISCFFGLFAVILAFSILTGRSADEIQRLVFVVLAVFWGPVGFVAGQYFTRR